MQRHAILIAALCLAITGAGNAQATAPTFDCNKASHEIETLICTDDDLAQKDQVLGKIFAEALDQLKGVVDSQSAIANLQAYQRGWLGGRNECWKADDKRQCTLDAYDRRIAELQATYSLVASMDPVFYSCENSPANEIVATFFETEPPAVRLERGDSQEVAIQGRSGSGARYEGAFGIVFWIKGDEARVEWPQGHVFQCTVGK